MSSVPAPPAVASADGAPAVPPTVAQATGLHEPSLHRLLRAMTGFGVLTQDEQGRFDVGPLGDATRHFPSLPWWLDLQRRFTDCLATGRSAFDFEFGQELFEFLEERPEYGARFDGIMRLMHAGEPEGVAAAYDFTGVRRLVDVGGGNGVVLSTLLAAHPHMEGVLFDLQQVVDRVDAAGRFEIVAGDFFASVPSGADAYLLSHIVHDWPREQALHLLRNCRHAIDDDGRLLLVEMVIPDGDDPHPARLFDMFMLLVNGAGQERTAAEYADLLDEAGFRLGRVVPTASPVSVIEAVPA
jgi:O-methyltransferase domain/IclR helix-turn-helix domain